MQAGGTASCRASHEAGWRISYSNLERHESRIRVASEPRQGTTVTVAFGQPVAMYCGDRRTSFVLIASIGKPQLALGILCGTILQQLSRCRGDACPR